MQCLKSFWRRVFGRKPEQARPSEKGRDQQDFGPVIAIIGCNGSGKSQFIYDITGSPEDQSRICHTLTQEQGQNTFNEVRTTLRDPSFPISRVTLIDTPGVDPNISGLEFTILRNLRDWLSERNLHLDGLIYTHNISDMMNTHKTNTRRSSTLFIHFPDLWRHTRGNAEKTVFVSTHWGRCSNGEPLEQVLRDGYWSEMHQKGSQMMRYESSGPKKDTAALSILRQIV